MTENMEKALKVAMTQAAKAEGFAYGAYTIYAATLREKGLYEAAMKLEELAANEKEHLERWMTKLGLLDKEGEDIIKTIIGMERHDANIMYTKLYTILVKNEGDPDLIEMVRHLAFIEARHAIIMDDLESIYYKGMSEEEVKKDRKGKWVCPHCGNFYYSKDEIPDKCPVCEHDRADYVWQEE